MTFGSGLIMTSCAGTCTCLAVAVVISSTVAGVDIACEGGETRSYS